MTDDSPSNDLDKRLREKIEQELEKRRQARLGSAADNQDDASPEPESATADTNEGDDSQAEADEPAVTTPVEEVVPTEEPVADQTEDTPEPAVTEAVIPGPEEDPEIEPQATVADANITEPPADDIPEVVVPQAEEADVPEVTVPADSEEDIPEISAPAVDVEPIPEVTALADDDNSVPEVTAVIEGDSQEDNPEKKDDDAKPADAEKSAKNDDSSADKKPSDDKDDKKPTNGAAGKRTKTASGMTGKKKKDPLAEFAKGPGKKKKAGGSKTRTSAGGRRTKGPSATRSLSENEQRLLEEKAKIDEKYRKQKMILYPAITVGTIVLGVALYFLAIFIRDFKNKPATPRQPTATSTSNSTSGQVRPSPQPPVSTSAYAKWADLEAAVDRLVSVQKEPGKAISEIKRYQKAKPDEEALCVEKIKSITESYLEQGLGSPGWKSMQPQINLGLKSTNPEDVELAISRLRSFAGSHPNEYFLADYMIQKLNGRYAQMTGGLMP